MSFASDDAETPSHAGDHDDALREVLRILDLRESVARTTEDIFTGPSYLTPHGRIYGGQVVAQSLLAAQRTVPADRILHSMHGYFLRPGDTAQDVTVAVDRIHDGRSFATRRSQAYQNGVPIWSMIASFQDEAPGVEHAMPMPAGIPEPESLPTDRERSPGLTPETTAHLEARAFEVRHVEEPLLVASDPSRAQTQHVWMRMRGPLPDDPALHRAALGFMSDSSIQEAALRQNGLFWGTTGLKLASLDHAIWWHRFARADEWLLYVQESPSTRGGRGLTTGRIYTRDGALVSTVAQEIMMRVPEGVQRLV